MLYSELKQTAIKDLSQYYYLKSSLDTLPQEIRLLQNSGMYHSAAYGMAVMSSVSADDRIAKHISRIEALEQQLENNTAKLKNINFALSCLTQSQRDILFSYYINRQRRAVNRLAIDTHTDRSALYRRATRALDKYILAYFGTLGDKE